MPVRQVVREGAPGAAVHWIVSSMLSQFSASHHLHHRTGRGEGEPIYNRVDLFKWASV